MKERRKLERVQSTVKAIVVQLRYAGVHAPEEQKTLFSTTENLSLHGAHFILDRDMPVDTPIRVTVIFQDPPHHFEHVGRVCWQRPLEPGSGFSTGIEFQWPSRAAVYAWESFLEASFPAAAKRELDSQQAS